MTSLPVSVLVLGIGIVRSQSIGYWVLGAELGIVLTLLSHVRILPKACEAVPHMSTQQPNSNFPLSVLLNFDGCKQSCIDLTTNLASYQMQGWTVWDAN